MAEILGSIVAYPIVGYSIFRLWCRLSPPCHGEYAFKSDEYVQRGGADWFIPGFLLHPRRLTQDGESLPRGMDVASALWLSLTIWPVLLVIFCAVKAGRASGRTVARLAIRATNKAIGPVTQSPDRDLVEAQREVNAICDASPGD